MNAITLGKAASVTFKLEIACHINKRSHKTTTILIYHYG